MIGSVGNGDGVIGSEVGERVSAFRVEVETDVEEVIVDIGVLLDSTIFCLLQASKNTKKYIQKNRHNNFTVIENLHHERMHVSIHLVKRI